MTNNDNDHDTLFSFGLILGFILGVFVGSIVVTNVQHKLAIRHGAAHYSTTTAAFIWNDEKEK